jgi:VWFA-related protein
VSVLPSYAALAMASLIATAFAGNPSPLIQAPAFDARVELVTLPVSVVDESGAAVTDLTAEDFVVFEGGAAQQVALVLAPGAAPLDVALLVDLSGSMVDADWRDHARDFLEALGGEDCAFLMGFSTNVGGSVWGRPDDEILIDALEQAAAAGGTALFDALLIALRELGAADRGGTLRGAARGSLNPDLRGTPAVGVRANNPCPAPLPPGPDNDPDHLRRKAVVVVSDGEDSSSSNDADAVRTAAEVSGIPVFPVQLDRDPRGGPPGGRRRIGATPLPPWAAGGVLPALAEATGGTPVRGTMSGYREVLARLRGSYVIGFYTSTQRELGGNVDFTRHEVRIEVTREGLDVVHPPAYFLPAIDTEAARFDVQEADELIAGGELGAALLLLDNALRADPGYAPAHFSRALALADLGRLQEAQESALQAAGLSPGVADMHEVAMLISLDVDDAATAWEQAVRAAQAGADVRRHFERLEAAGPAPPDFDARVAAPSIMVARPYTEATNLLMDTALAKVFQTVRRELAARQLVGVTVDPSRARYIMTIRGDRLTDTRPRRLEGQMIVTELTGAEVYDKVFLLNDVDSPARIAQDLGRFLRDLEEKLAPAR